MLHCGPATVGDVICFEVAYDGLVRDTVTGGAQLLVVQTNNATFGRTAEARQQLAMVRLRAVEHGRDSADGLDRRECRRFIAPDGRVHEPDGVLHRSDVSSAYAVAERTRTLATTLGSWPELSLAGGAGCRAGAIRARYGDALGDRRRRQPTTGNRPELQVG